MKREIKFRAWNPDWDEMVYSSLEIIFDKREFYPFGFEVGFSHYPTEGWTIMQCTGLRDLNDKEIYEGDILTSKYYPFQDLGILNYNAEVYWDEGALQFCIQLHCVNSNKRGISDSICECLTERGIQFEVIGNIYENPKLLEYVITEQPFAGTVREVENDKLQ